jgi:hypothetical protein
MGDGIIITDRIAQAGALQPDAITTLADYGDEQVNREQMMGARHKGIANGTRYHNYRQA